MKGLGRTIGFAVLAAVITMFALIYALGLEPIEAFYLSFTIGSATAAAVALSEREANIGTVASAISLLLLLALAGPYLGLHAVFVFKTQTTTISIPIEIIPWIMMGVVAIFAVGYAVGANVGRLGLWTLGTVLSLFWFTVSDVTGQVLLACIVGVIAAVPLLTTQSRPSTPLFMVAMLPVARNEITFDLSQVNYLGMLLSPILLFVALDPFNAFSKVVRELGSVVTLFLVFLQVLSAVL